MITSSLEKKKRIVLVPSLCQVFCHNNLLRENWAVYINRALRAVRPVRAPNSALGGADARVLRSGSSDPKGAIAARLEMFTDSFKHPCVKKFF